MKKLKSEMHEISTVEIWAAGTLFFSTGALAGGVLFGVFSTGGNAADVVAAVGAIAAAVGTWVIGYGAWKYAREAHALRQSEIRAERIAQLEDKFALLNRLRYIIFCTQNSMQNFGSDLEDESIPIDAVDFLAACETCSAYISSQDWDEVSLMARDPKGLDMLSALRLWVRDMKKECEEVTAPYRQKKPEKTLPRDRIVKNLIISVGGIGKVCTEIAAYEEARRSQLLAEAEMLELTPAADN